MYILDDYINNKLNLKKVFIFLINIKNLIYKIFKI